MTRLPVLLMATILFLACDRPIAPSPEPNVPGSPLQPQAAELKPTPLEVIHEFYKQYPTGVTISHNGRIFVSYPRWEDPVEFTVAEIKNGEEVPYPDKALASGMHHDQLFSVQSVVVDPQNRLWALDTGSVDFGEIKGQKWPKLVQIDLGTDKVVRIYRFPSSVVHKYSYLNDVRFDLRRGTAGYAFITDSSMKGSNGIIVVDLETGQSWRKLDNHSSVRPDKTFVSEMEGRGLRLDKKGELPRAALVGSDGIAISPDGERLYYSPLTGRELYSVSVQLLENESSSDRDVEASIKSEKRTFASDGLLADSAGRLYLTDWEHNAISVRYPSGVYKTLVHDSRMWWPDTMTLSPDGRLIFTATQLHRQRKFNNGTDLRQRPYLLFQTRVDARPTIFTAY